MHEAKPAVYTEPLKGQVKKTTLYFASVEWSSINLQSTDNDNVIAMAREKELQTVTN